MVNQHVYRSRQPLSGVVVVRNLSVNTLVVRVEEDTLLVGEVKECTDRAAVSTCALDAQLVVLRESCARASVLPVSVVDRLAVLEQTLVGEDL